MEKELNFKGFTQTDDDLIKHSLQTQGRDAPWELLASAINKHSYVIIQRAFQLGLVKYSDYNHVLLSHRPDGWRSDELDFLIYAYEFMNVKEISSQLGRTTSSVRKQIYEFGLSANSQRKWSDVELELLSKIHEIGVNRFARHCWRNALEVKHQAIKQGFSREGSALTNFPGRAGNSSLNLGVG